MLKEGGFLWQPGQAPEVLARSFEPSDELSEVHPGRPAHLSDFQEVESSFPGLVLAHERLWSPEPFGDVTLPQACLAPDLAQELAESLLVGPPPLSWHARRVGSPCELSQNGICVLEHESGRAQLRRRIDVSRAPMGLVVGVLIVATACASRSSVPTSYLGRLPGSEVVFLQWTRTGQSAKGSLTIAYIDPRDPTRVSTEDDAFTGVLNGSSVTLSLASAFASGSGLVHTLHGSLAGSGLSISVTTNNGSIQTVALTPATVADYNAAIRPLQAQAAATLQQQQAQQEIEAKQQAIDQASQQLNSGVYQLSQDVLSLPYYGTRASVPSDIAQVRGDLQALQAAESALPSYVSTSGLLPQQVPGVIFCAQRALDAANKWWSESRGGTVWTVPYPKVSRNCQPGSPTE